MKFFLWGFQCRSGGTTLTLQLTIDLVEHMTQRHPAIFVGQSPIAGRGVFAAEAIEEGTVIEVCPVIILPPEDLEVIHRTFLHDYYFLWSDEECAIALGYGSLYNHRAQPNADYRMDYDNQTIDFFCLTPIAAGEEITVNYVDGGLQQGELWFKE